MSNLRFAFRQFARSSDCAARMLDTGVVSERDQSDGGAAGRMRTRLEFSLGTRGHQAC